jgi:HEAT repeat protein
MLSVARNGTPTAIWEALEHGERVECLECIPAIAPLLYDSSPVTREIAAWWLRRRIFGVFGPGEVYERTVQTLKNDASPTKRAYAAQALGEFLATPGIEACADAVANDKDAQVRAAATLALARLNDEGKGAVSKALGDSERAVKLAGLRAAGRINSFRDTAAVVRLTGDGDNVVRKRAVEVIGSHRVKEAAAALIGLAQNDPDADVRGAACHSLGFLGDASARGPLETIATNDSNGFVRDLARISLRRL